MEYTMILSMIGGLGLFLFGMKLMSTGLEKAAGAKLRHILEIFTTNRFSGMIVGLLFTAIIQSSSATTVMIVSFVNAGLMNLSQAAGVILGANIGTTVTSQLVSFNLEEIAPIFLMAGVIMAEFMHNPTVRRFGEVVLGFGILFTGLATMSGSMAGLKDSPMIMDALAHLDNHFLGVLFGFIITAILQSSSVTVSIVLLMVAKGLLPLPICFFIIIGCNMGSCVSALIASLGGNKNAKRAAMIHFLFNVFGSIIIFAGLTFGLDAITAFFTRTTGGNLARSVANAHTTFKIVEVVLMFPVANLVAKLAARLIPGEDKKARSAELQYIGEHSMMAPTTVIPQAKLEICHLANMAKDNLELSIGSFLHKDDSKLNKIFETEVSIDYISHAITDYLLAANQLSLPVADRALLGGMFHSVSDIERIGDHATNFAEFTQTEIKHNTGLSDDAKKEIKTMYASISQLIDLSIETFKDNNEENIQKIKDLEDSIDAMERKYQKRHIKRMTRGQCDPQAGLLFSDMLSALERIADHSMNIVFSINDDYDDDDELQQI